jgi:GT2 family glycosyltransferase
VSTETTPSFSVVIPTLGRSESLQKTLESVLGCDPAPTEILVVDGDGSSFGDIHDAKLRVTCVACERGLTRQRNHGMRVASGDVVVFLDDDVVVPPDAFGMLADSYGDPGVVGATGRVIEPTAGRVLTKEGRIRRFLIGGGAEGGFTRFGYPRRAVDPDRPRAVEFMQGCFMSARLDAAREVGFDESLPGYALAEDEDFSFRLSRKGELRYDPRIVIVHMNMGFLSKDQRAFGRDVVVNRTYLFRKNFEQTPLARVQFCLFIGMLFVHRAINREWAGMRGLLDGSLMAWRSRR